MPSRLKKKQGRKLPLSEAKIKNYAFLLLKYRLRSEKELFHRLKKKGFPEEKIKELISFLKERNFLNDEEFAREWIASRLRKGFGLRRISEELREKGISQQLWEEEFSKLNYCEKETVEELARRKFAKLKDLPYFKARNRLYAYLMRRGFSNEIVQEVLDNLCRQIP